MISTILSCDYEQMFNRNMALMYDNDTPSLFMVLAVQVLYKSKRLQGYLIILYKWSDQSCRVIMLF